MTTSRCRCPHERPSNRELTDLVDEAAEMDPEGEHAKPVVKARASIDAWKRTTDPSEKPHQKPGPGLSRAAKTIAEGSDRVFSLHQDGLLSSVERLAFDGGRA
jgi:hypothetical protein